MKIAPYYQKLLEDALQAAKSFEPITYAGMFDSGVDYLFNLFIPLVEAELENDTVSLVVDLSGLTRKEEIESEITFALSNLQKDIPSVCDFASLTRHIQQIAVKKKVVLTVYLGQEGNTAMEFFLFLNRLRNMLAWRFTYVVFGTTRVLFDERYFFPLLKKVFKRNIQTVLPLRDTDARIVLANYEERYAKKLPETQRQNVLQNAGGNPGLIKALYLQVSDREYKNKINVLDERLAFRLEGIACDIPEKDREALASSRKIRNTETQLHLIQYGYLVQDKSGNRPFTPLLADYLIHKKAQKSDQTKTSKPEDNKLLLLTKSQRLVLNYMEGHIGALITKDDIAKVLWGESWAERYSDWAIDQLISTLRERMGRMKHRGRIITKKGEGIIFLTTKKNI